MTIDEFKIALNRFAATKTAFFFIVDFELQRPFVCRISETRKQDIRFRIEGFSNHDPGAQETPRAVDVEKIPIQKTEYHERFRIVKRNIEHGNSYLVNLTFPTRIHTDLSLRELYALARAPYKLFFKNQFVIFSPECFVKIRHGRIFSFPMKGTIDATLPDAEEKLLADRKELFEHYTIVDLIRNDLSMVAEDVVVARFRYVERVQTNQKDLLQTSSKIQGRLPDDWPSRLGDILLRLLPAGSVSGAPKKKTVEIIRAAEEQDRGYFTGVFGVFDGENLTSAVNIRYIEQTHDGLQFRSGGGITALSDPDEEYEEMVDKVYVPVV